MLKLLALSLPGGNSISTSVGGLKPSFINLASILSDLLNIAFYLAGFLALYWLIWGSFQYLIAQGNKEGLAKARERIRWAIVGLFVVFIAYFIAKFVGEIFPPDAGKGVLPF